jgi:hypothetical protein
MGASKASGGWQESVNDHTTMTASDDKRQRHGQMMKAVTKRARVARAMVNEGGG